MNKTKKLPAKLNVLSVRAIAVLLLLAMLAILFSLFKIQVLSHKEIEADATGQYYRNTFYAPSRGDIFDRNGVKIAGSSYEYRVGITPKHLRSRTEMLSTDEIIDKLASVLGLEAAEIRSQIPADEKALLELNWLQLAENVPEEKGIELENFIRDNDIGGVRLDAEPKRYYLNGNLASQVIGFAGRADQTLKGRFGLELDLDAELSGKPGFNYAARDNYLSHGTLPYSKSQNRESTDGNTVYVTLDMNIQKILQEELEAGIKAYDAADDGMGIVMNPYTGEIYAMASYPYFRSDDPFAAPSGVDPAEWNPQSSEEYQRAWKNKTVTNLYEAGSTMKAITAAIGLEEGVTDEKNYYSDDPIQVLDAEISCVTGAGHGVESMEEGFWRSCNPVFVQIADAIGIETFYDYIRAFGFNEPTGIELSGEPQCIFHKDPSRLDMANLSFGESSSVTPLHLMRAFSAIVNGGKLVTPHLVKEIVDAGGKVVEAPGSGVTRRVISSETSARVRRLMQGMVEYTKDYTNTWGYSIGGKTSTSTDELTGLNTISFMAAGPIEHPQILVLMILQKPTNEKIGGSEAQIVTQNTMSRILSYMNIDRHYGDLDAYKMTKTIETPDFIGYTVREAAESLTFQAIPVVAGDDLTLADSVIKYQLPAPGTIVFPGTKIYVYKDVLDPVESVIPDFSEMNYDEIINACNETGLVPQFEGALTGICVSQKMAENTDLPPGSKGMPGSTAYRGSVIKIALAIGE